MLWVVDEQTGGEFEALHGEFPVVVAGVVESILNHSILSQLFQHPHRLVLHARLVERCIDKHTLPLLPTDGTDGQIDGHTDGQTEFPAWHSYPPCPPDGMLYDK